MYNSTLLTNSFFARGTLYRLVFFSRLSCVVAVILIVTFFLQPIDRAYADEVVDFTAVQAPLDTSVATVENPTVIVEEDGLSLSDDVADAPPNLIGEQIETVVQEQQTSEQLLSNSSSTSTEVLPVTVSREVSSTSVPQTETDSADEVPIVENTVPNLALDSIVDESSEESVNQADQSLTEASSTLSVDLEREPTGSSTQASTTGGTAVAVSTVMSDTQIQFDKSDCVAVANGSYYCQTKPVVTEQPKDGLSVLPDSDGDLEIYFTQNGTTKQITYNTLDDAAPYFDSISNTIVWHRLVDDRYQIIAYDIQSGTESQLTTDSVNNMEPTRAGQYTAWQHWNNNNWDIMLFDGSLVRLLTETPEHDIAPSVRSNLVVWNKLTNEKTQTIELYDTESGEYTTIEDTDGGALSNPRMVLVYETEFQNGDIITKGYDVLTGEITSLSTLPAEIPAEIPEPDSTGETRALIQIKSSTEEDGDDLPVTSLGKFSTLDPVSASSTGTSSQTVTLVVKQDASASTTQPSLPPVSLVLDLSSTSEIVLTTDDLVIPPFSLATTSLE